MQNRRMLLLSVMAVLLLTAGASGMPRPGETAHLEPLAIDVDFPAVQLFSREGDVAASVNTQLHRTALDMIGWLISYGNVTGSYVVDLDQNDLVSVTMQYAGFTKYMAHPAHLATSLAFDMTTGKRLFLTDLFIGDDFIDVLSGYVAEQIEDREIPLLRPFESIVPEQDFRLTPDGLIIYFQPYDLAPYAWGFPEFYIPYEKIVHLANDYIARLAQAD